MVEILELIDVVLSTFRLSFLSVGNILMHARSTPGLTQVFTEHYRQ